ncbi:glycosyltransferase family 4 protein [Thermodesulfobacteriota bacterium]
MKTHLKKVLILGHSYLATENRKQLNALARHINVVVLSPRRWHEGMTQFDIDADRVEGRQKIIHFVREYRFPYLPHSQYVLPGLRKAVRSIKPDLIHIESDPWTTFAVQMILVRNSLDRKIPIVCTAKQNTYTSRSWLLDVLKKQIGLWGIRNVARFIAVSDAVPDLYARHFNLPVQYFDRNTHLGVDTELFCPVNQKEKYMKRRHWLPANHNPETFLVGYCGRLEEYKGITDLIEAIKNLRPKLNIDVKVFFLGDGSMKQHLDDLRKRESFIHLFSQVSHAAVAGFMKSLDLFVMPARKTKDHEEHDAHAVIEALACGLHCIGTDSGAIPDVIGDAGTIVPSQDTTELARAIGSHISRFSDQKNEIPEFNVKGRNRAEKNFSLDAVARKNLNTYIMATEEWNTRTG